MQFDGAVVKERGVTFAIVVVKPYVIQNRAEASRKVGFCGTTFPGMPIILMTQDVNGLPAHYGRKDIVNFLTNIDPSRIPWKRYTVALSRKRRNEARRPRSSSLSASF